MFTLDRVVPWGRSYDEYWRMFALSDDDARGRLLGCADGPANVAAVADAIRTDGLRVTIERVPYEFVRGGNQMMCIAR